MLIPILGYVYYNVRAARCTLAILLALIIFGLYVMNCAISTLMTMEYQAHVPQQVLLARPFADASLLTIPTTMRTISLTIFSLPQRVALKLNQIAYIHHLNDQSSCRIYFETLKKLQNMYQVQNYVIAIRIRIKNIKMRIR